MIAKAPTRQPRAPFTDMIGRGDSAHWIGRAGVSPPVDLAMIERHVAARFYVDVLFRANRR